MVIVTTRRDLTKIRRNQTTLVKNASLPLSQTRLSWSVHGSRAKNTLFNESFEISREQRKHQRRIWPIPTEPGTSLRSRVEIITRGKNQRRFSLSPKKCHGRLGSIFLANKSAWAMDCPGPIRAHEATVQDKGPTPHLSAWRVRTDLPYVGLSSAHTPVPDEKQSIQNSKCACGQLGTRVPGPIAGVHQQPHLNASPFGRGGFLENVQRPTNQLAPDKHDQQTWTVNCKICLVNAASQLSRR